MDFQAESEAVDDLAEDAEEWDDVEDGEDNSENDDQVTANYFLLKCHIQPEFE